jgi:L-asparaginase
MFTLGGTIAMANRPADNQAGAVVTRLTGADLIAGLPGLAETGVDLDVRDARAVPSANLTVADIVGLVADASAAISAGADGVVVTQGTDTVEETAFLADLIWPHQEPIVFTGAMRNPTLAGPDGPANVLAAIQAAASVDARDLGAVLVFSDQIHAARWIRKTHATSTATFASPNAGPIGLVVEGRVRILTRPLRFQPLAIGATDARVGLYTATLDDDTGLLRTLAADCQGLVIAGYGVGHVPSAMAPVLEEIAASMPVVLVSRTGAGPVLHHTYGAVGSETDLQRRGLINGGLLDAYKARILLKMLLGNGAGHAVIAAEFARRG